MDFVGWLLAQMTPEQVSTPPTLPSVDPDVTEIVKQAGIFASALAGVIVGLVEAAKRAGVPCRFAPALGLALGLGLSLSWEASTATHPPVDWWLAAVEGIMAGLMAGGLYSVTKSLINPRSFEPDAPRRRSDRSGADYKEVRKKS